MQVSVQPRKPETPAERNVRIVKEQGVAHPEAVAAILKPFDQQTAAGSMPWGDSFLDNMYYRKLDIDNMSHEHYLAIRTHSPQLFGLLPIGKRW